MCIMCVEIMRERISVADALKAAGNELALADQDPPYAEHLREILRAANEGDTKKVAELVKAGYKKERWV